MKRIILAMAIASCLVACSNKGGSETSGEAAGAARGNDAALPIVERAVRVFGREEPTVDLVAAELRGVVMARTTAQAIMHYDGYRIILTTPGDVVTRIDFQFDEARPSIQQLTDMFGRPTPRGEFMLFTHLKQSLNQTIELLATPASTPVEEATLVKALRIQGARRH